MAFINIIAIVLLSKWALACFDDYEIQRKEGKDPVFYADSIPGLPKTECWHKTFNITPKIKYKLDRKSVV